MAANDGPIPVRTLAHAARLLRDAHQLGDYMRENFQAVLDRAGHGRKVVSLPAAPAIAALRMLRAAGVSPLYDWIYETAALESFVSTERLERKLGYVPRRSNRAALGANYDWYVAHRDELRGRSGTTHRVPWKKGFLRWAKRLF